MWEQPDLTAQAVYDWMVAHYQDGMSLEKLIKWYLKAHRLNPDLLSSTDQKILNGMALSMLEPPPDTSDWF